MFFSMVRPATFVLIFGIGAVMAGTQGRDELSAFPTSARLALVGLGVVLLGIGAIYWIYKIREYIEIDRLARFEAEERRRAKERVSAQRVAPALTLALYLGLTAPDDERARAADLLADDLAVGMDESTVEMCRASALERWEAGVSA